MAKNKLTTAEILAAARAKDSGGAAPPEAGQSEPPAAKETAAEKAPAEAAGSGEQAEPSAEPEPPASKPAPGGAPKSTADILAAARAQASGGGGKPSKPAASAKPAPKKAAGTPKSTADILAAARAQKAGGGSAPAAKAAPQKAAAAKPKAGGGVAVAERPPVDEMIRQAREGRTAAAEAKPVRREPKKPVAPRKPVAEKDTDRRGFLAALAALPVFLLTHPFAAAWTLFVTATSAAVLGLARYMMPNVLVEPPSQFKIGPASDYPPGMVSTKWKAQFGVWIVNTTYRGQQLIYALSTVCTHLGCTPNWLEGEQKFKCPCHGSGFYINGINFEGPAPRPLERVGIRVAPDGMVEVDKSQKFQEELGQWADPASYIEVT